MPRKRAADPKSGEASRPVSLKMLAEYLDLSPATVSFVLNNAPNRSIPERTRERVREAAKKFGYKPSHIARSLQGARTFTIGVLLPEIGNGYHSQVLEGAAEVLMKNGYFFLTAHHRHKVDLVDEYPGLLISRGTEGLLFIDTHLEKAPACPAVTIAAHSALAGVSNVVLDHERGAELALGHLYRLGHRRIVYMRGQEFSSDSRARWNATLHVARSLGLTIAPELVMHLDRDSHSPELGYERMQQMLMRRRDFTAVLCFNDVAAFGVIRALADAGLRVPDDVSVVGFDDILAAEFYTPRLTTIRQPLQQMGAVAASLLLEKIKGAKTADLTRIEPELIERESTAKAVAAKKRS
jgi:LacI family transcriptional regulator